MTVGVEPAFDETLFRMALDLAGQITPLSPAEADAIKPKGMGIAPLFQAGAA